MFAWRPGILQGRSGEVGHSSPPARCLQTHAFSIIIRGLCHCTYEPKYVVAVAALTNFAPGCLSPETIGPASERTGTLAGRRGEIRRCRTMKMTFGKSWFTPRRCWQCGFCRPRRDPPAKFSGRTPPASTRWKRGLERGQLQFDEFRFLEQVSADTDFVTRLGEVARLHLLRFRLWFSEGDLVRPPKSSSAWKRSVP